MPKIKYQEVNFQAESLAKIEIANEIVAAYHAQGLDLTLRQLYYQFVSRSHIANNEREYKKLGSIINDARLAGLIDWEAIVDRTRYVRQLAHWDSPQNIVDSCASQFRTDKWNIQPEYVEVWIEKDALIGVIEGICEESDVPYLACRGYASASEVWRAGQRIQKKIEDGKEVTIFYLGDHDPSGIDMTRDVEARLNLFAGSDEIHVKRLALNMDQVEEHQPPPNPTKMSDSRANWYVDRFGDECWELDALDPATIRELVGDAIAEHRNKRLWSKSVRTENDGRRKLSSVAKNWDSVVEFLNGEV